MKYYYKPPYAPLSLFDKLLGSALIPPMQTSPQNNKRPNLTPPYYGRLMILIFGFLLIHPYKPLHF